MAAVACSKILKELAKEEEDMDSLEEMLALADECEHRAIGELGRSGSPCAPRALVPGLHPCSCPARAMGTSRALTLPWV